MKKRFGSLARSFAIGLAFTPIVCNASLTLAQEVPAVDAFIAGIEDYDERQVVRPPREGGDIELPPNVLPADDTEVVVSEPLVPATRTAPPSPSQSTDFSTDDPWAAPTADQPAASETAATNIADDTGNDSKVGSDYFDSEVSDAVVANYNCNWVVGVNIPIFDREFDGNRLFSVDPTDLTRTLESDHADPNGASGIDFTIGRRNSFGWGWEARYWGLYAAANTATLGGSPETRLNGLSQINDNGTSLADTFNASDYHTLTRDYTLHNVELNMLRNGRTYAPLGKAMSVEWLTGLRYLQFDESLEYAAISSSNTVIRSALNSSVENSLLGAQLGSRCEWYLYDRLSFSMGAKLGFFNNRAKKNIVATNQLSNLNFRRPVISSGPNTNAEFNFSDESKDDFSVLGEFDLGVIYQLSLRSRFRMGYRVLGASNIADSEKNIPGDFRDVTELGSANTYGDLVLRGAYIGLEKSF